MSTRDRGAFERAVSRREFLRIGGLGGGALLLAACGTVQQPAPAEEADATQPAGGTSNTSGGAKTTLQFWTPGGSPTFCNAHNQIAQGYERQNQNVDMAKVNCFAGDNFVEALLARVAAGNPPDATILWDTPVSLGARGSLEQLDSYMQTARYAQAENWPENVLASCQFGGRTYGLPVTAGTYGIWYNAEMFEKKGIPSGRDEFPKTWAELRNLSKEFTQWKGDRLETAGFLPWSDAVHLNIWSALNGSQLYDAENQKYTIDSEQNVEMMQFSVDWLNEEYKGDITKVNRSAAWGVYPGEQNQQPAFQTGRLAALVEGSWVLGDLYASVQPTFENWNVASFPVGPGGERTVSGYWPNWLVIPKGSKNPEEAFKYLDYMSGVGVKDWFAAVPDMPTNEKVGEILPQIVVSKRGRAFAQDVMAFFRGQAEVATPMWTSPVQSFANDQITRATERIMTKAATPQAALAEAQKASQAELEKVLRSA